MGSLMAMMCVWTTDSSIECVWGMVLEGTVMNKTRDETQCPLATLM
jgi:hypothetical protein